MSIRFEPVTTLQTILRENIETNFTTNEAGENVPTTRSVFVTDTISTTRMQPVQLQDEQEVAIEQIAQDILDDHDDGGGLFSDALEEQALADFLSDGPALRDFVLARGGSLDDIAAVASAVIDRLDDDNGNLFSRSDRAQVLRKLALAPDADLPASPSVDEARAYLAFHPPLSNDPHQWTSPQRAAFDVLGNAFGTIHSAMHTEWHRVNGAGGTQGPGSGLAFLDFHREMMLAFSDFAGIPFPTGWDPNSTVPPELRAPSTTNPRITSDTSTTRPNWLSVGGGGDAQGNLDFGATVTIDGQVFGALEDFQNPDQLGRALGETPYHSSVHSQIGGVMATFGSPQDPAFYLWHGHIDALIDEWLATPNGQAWANANPNSELFTVSGMHG